MIISKRVFVRLHMMALIKIHWRGFTAFTYNACYGIRMFCYAFDHYKMIEDFESTGSIRSLAKNKLSQKQWTKEGNGEL
jgi:hypothetical protein